MVNLLKNKQKHLKIKEKKQINALEVLKPKEIESIKDKKSDNNKKKLMKSFLIKEQMKY